MNNRKSKFIILLIFCLGLFFQTGCLFKRVGNLEARVDICCGKKEKPKKPICVDAAIKKFNPKLCIQRCQDKAAKVGADDSLCKSACASLEKRYSNRVQNICFKDQDGDGIQDFADWCPATPIGSKVNWRGCADSDGDSVADVADACSGTLPGTLVDLRGCHTEPVCHGSKCTLTPQKCENEKECDRLTEIPVILDIPKEARDKEIKKELRRRIHTIACPGDTSPPPQPRWIQPASMIHTKEIGPVAVYLLDGKATSGEDIEFTFKWERVHDSCEPVTYSLYVEYYHCHFFGGLKEPASYHNRGWCRWMPYEYESLPGNQKKIKIPLGKFFYNIHVPFIEELHWDDSYTGAFPIRYMPFWFRVRVLAHDGNGLTSNYGMHEDKRYVVIYPDKGIPLHLLTRIPVGP